MFARNILGDKRDYFSYYYVPNVEIIMTAQLVIYQILLFQNKLQINCNYLSKQIKLKDPQQISFIGKLLATRRATVFFIIEKSGETTFNFPQNSVTII